MFLNRAAAIVLRQFYLMRGSPSRMLPLFIWIAVDMVMWGFMTRYLNHFATGGFDFVPALLGAVVFWDFFIRIMQGVTITFFEDVWSRNFLNIFATPLSIPEYLCGLVLSSITTSTVGVAVMFILASLIFGLSFSIYGLMLFPFLLVLFIFGIALGVAGCAVVLRLGPASEWFIWPIPALLSPFVGVLYPLSTLPDWMRFFSWLLPPSYVFEGMRSTISGGAISIGALLWGGVLALIYLMCACAFFVRIHKHAVRTGLFARYSAETLS